MVHTANMNKIGIFIVILVIIAGFIYITHRSVEKPKTESDIALIDALRKNEAVSVLPGVLPVEVEVIDSETLTQEDETEKIVDTDGDVTETEKIPQQKPQVTILRTGTFNPDAQGSDPAHRGWGNVMIVDFDGKKKLVTGEDFRVTNGPAYHVYLVPGVNVETGSAFLALKDKSIDIGEMNQFSGYQVFTLPDDLDITGLNSVVIWCESFSQFISVADIQS